MKHLKYIIGIYTVIFLFCSEISTAQNQITPKTTFRLETGDLGDATLNRIFSLPLDSLSKDEILKLYKFQDLFISNTYCDLISGDIKSRLTKEIMVKHGLTPQYYDFFMDNQKKNNEFRRTEVPSVAERIKMYNDGIKRAHEYQSQRVIPQ